jgi:chaperonin cofactor prefoldin
MSEPNADANGGQTATAGNADGVVTGEPVAIPSEVLEQAVLERLTPIKTKLDGAFKERDTLARELAEMKEASKRAEIERLEKDGKQLEAAQMRINELEGRLSAINKANDELTRDRLLNESTAHLEFRNEAARKMAMNDILSQVVKNDLGEWVHLSGRPMRDFIEAFAKDDDKSFLFKPKPSSGSSMTGGTPPKAPASELMTKPLSKMSSEEIMQAAAAGRFGSPEALSFNS